MPPRLSIPGPDEESMRPRIDEAVVPVPEAPVPEAPVPEAPETLSPSPAARPSPLPPVPATPKPSGPPDDNLFNSRYRSKAMRKFAIGLGENNAQADDRGVRAATHVMPADMKTVPRVPFDPVTETRRLRGEQRSRSLDK